MIHKLLLTASVTALLAGSANASLVFGVSNFWNVAGSSATNPVLDFGGSLFNATASGATTSNALNQSNDGTYGDWTFGPAAPTGNRALVGANFTLNIQNISSETQSLAALLFDVGGTSTAGTYTYEISVNGGSPIHTDTYTISTVGTAGFQSLRVALGSLPLAPGDFLNIRLFGVGGSPYLDNIAGLIPEPSGALALAGLLSAGLLVRSNRGRRVSKAPTLA